MTEKKLTRAELREKETAMRKAAETAITRQGLESIAEQAHLQAWDEATGYAGAHLAVMDAVLAALADDRWGAAILSSRCARLAHAEGNEREWRRLADDIVSHSDAASWLRSLSDEGEQMTAPPTPPASS